MKASAVGEHVPQPPGPPGPEDGAALRPMEHGTHAHMILLHISSQYFTLKCVCS